MQNRNNPLQVLGTIVGFISLMVMVTVIISTATFMRNKKSNRILPNRRIRRRHQPQRQHLWSFKNLFRTPDSTRERFTAADEEQAPQTIGENVNYNNNLSNVVRHWSPLPPPPSAPSLPPPPPAYFPGERQWVIPTVSATVVPKPRKKMVNDRQDTVNRALVSELKMRLEQKRMMSP